MKDRLLRIYDFFAKRPAWLWCSFGLVMTVLIVLAATLRYDEDIIDFMPLTHDERLLLDSLQAQQEAARIVLVIEGEDSFSREDALYAIEDSLAAIHYALRSSFDSEGNALSSQIKSVLCQQSGLSSDSAAVPPLLSPDSIRAALLRDKAILATPGGSALAPFIRRDPLQLIDYSAYQLFLANRTFAYLESPYGGTETRHNALLLDSLTAVTESVAAAYPDLCIRWTGAPVIAVGNARRIKTDTMLCISLSTLLIVLLLAYAFPRRRDWWLILLSVSVGWLTGMALLHIVTPTVSALVLGIGSVLIGIAVNYPLHLLVHQRYTTSVRQTLDEVLSPLIVGNITTVGAFLALIPMQATALRHLGIFAAGMLGGTILFCIFVLPHLMSAEPTPVREIPIRKLTRNPRVTACCQWAVVGITLVLLVANMLYTRRNEQATIFNSQVTTLNYMTDQQREDMAILESFMGNNVRSDNTPLSMDPEEIIDLIQREALAIGFRPDAFQPFYDLLREAASPRQPEDTSSVSQMMSRVTERLSEQFDYIGLVCSLIVFVFLWIAFKRLSLAFIAFLPMLLSWVWIIAIMQSCHLQFNIVNIILATFIFGQGDDYTIFIVEGLMYERRTGKPILPQYSQSILLSALIMLISIGILVFAVHPAMHSLGAVTLIGMTVVLIMAGSIPPLFFRVIDRFLNKM